MKTSRRSFLGGLFGAAFILSDEGEVIAEPERVRTYSFLPGQKPVLPDKFHDLCAAIRDVYSAEIYFSAQSILRFDSFYVRGASASLVPIDLDLGPHEDDESDGAEDW